MNEKDSYKQIFNATSLFGGVQFLVIFISVLRVKLIALMVGAAGIGLFGLLINFVNLFHSIVGLGLSHSSAKFIAEEKTESKQKDIVSTIRQLSIFSALLGMVLSVFFSKIISQLVFGDESNSNTIIVLSLAVLFIILETCELAVLQGYRKIFKLAKARIFSGIFALIAIIPIIYFYKLEGIAYSIVSIYFINYIVVIYFSDYKLFFDIKIDLKKFIEKSKPILKLSLAMAVSGVLVFSSAIIVKSYISSDGSLLELGYYEAGFLIVNSYASLIFMSMAKDYFPRLSADNNNNNKLELISNQQIEIGLLIIFPLIISIIMFKNIIIAVLYSSQFKATEEYVMWALLGVVFKLVSWSQGYIILAKGRSKIFMSYELVGSLIFLITHIIGYKYWGLKGLGIGYLVYNVSYFIIVYAINFSILKVKLKKMNFILIFLILITTIPLLIFNNYGFKINNYLTFLINSLILISVSKFSLRKLYHRIYK